MPLTQPTEAAEETASEAEEPVVEADADSELEAEAETEEEPVLSGDMLEYDVLIPKGISGLGQIDLRFSTGLSNASNNDWICDEQGIPCRDTDLADISGQWTHRKIAFGIDKTWIKESLTAGGKLKSIVLISEVSSEENLKVYLDNIVITNQGKERMILFRNGEGPLLHHHRSLTIIDRMEEQA